MWSSTPPPIPVWTAEDAAGEAFAVNATGAGAVAQAAWALGMGMIHVSSDYVFEGKAEPYAPGDLANPLGIYGASKLAGERAVMAAVPAPA
jgi:dTDP-4-dehydrorhamnose reductase